MNTLKQYSLTIAPMIIAVSSGLPQAYAAGAIDITNMSFSQTSPNCELYAANYKSTVQDVDNNRLFTGSTKISVKNGRCYFESNAIPNHNFNDGAWKLL